jgi:NADPH-dependent 2,4-dienoyl-CoA reductase/sulfur reductase-like enzyme
MSIATPAIDTISRNTFHRTVNEMAHKPSIPTPSYPTRCLQFLKHIHNDDQANEGNGRNETNGLNESNGHNVKGHRLNNHGSAAGSAAVEQAAIPLSIIIVGAGLGGLAAAIALARRGHSITVLEQALELGEVTMSFVIQQTNTDSICIRSERAYKYPQIPVVSC